MYSLYQVLFLWKGSYEIISRTMKQQKCSSSFVVKKYPRNNYKCLEIFEVLPSCIYKFFSAIFSKHGKWPPLKFIQSGSHGRLEYISALRAIFINKKSLPDSRRDSMGAEATLPNRTSLETHGRA